MDDNRQAEHRDINSIELSLCLCSVHYMILPFSKYFDILIYRLNPKWISTLNVADIITIMVCNTVTQPCTDE